MLANADDHAPQDTCGCRLNDPFTLGGLQASEQAHSRHLHKKHDSKHHNIETACLPAQTVAVHLPQESVHIANVSLLLSLVMWY